MDKFKGSICIDIAPRGPLEQYFEFEKEQRARYLIYNPDSNFEELKLWNSTFLTYTKDLILGDEHYDLDSVSMTLRNDTAKLFNDD